MPGAVVSAGRLAQDRGVGFGLSRRAQPRKAKGALRGLLGRAPDPAEVGERLGRIARRMLGKAVRDASARRLTLELHPAARPVRLVVTAEGELELTAETSAIGPAYQLHVLAKLAPVLEELEFAWIDPEPEDGELASVQRAMGEWLAGELEAGVTRFGLPRQLAFKLDAALLTPMGPRDRAWCDAVIADPLRCADAFAWWDEGPGQYERSCALLAMWQEVPWREPLDHDERALMEEVDGDLRAARRADRELALPWAEWAELCAWLGEDEARITELAKRAKVPSSIGYRRHPLEVELAAGWTIDLPGAFVGSWEDDGERYWATDGDRMIEFTCLTAGEEDDSDRLLAVAPEAHPVIAWLSEGERRGRAEAYDEGDVHIVHGLMAAAPEVAILTCKGTPADETWALETWRSLRRAVPKPTTEP